MFTWTGMVTVVTKRIGWDASQDVDLRGVTTDGWGG